MQIDLDIRPLAQWAIFALLAVIGLMRGAGPERATISTLLGMIVTDRIYHWAVPGGWVWERIDLGHVAIDSLGALCLFQIALKSNRIYPICLAGLQFVALVAHFGQAISPAVNRAGYHSLMVLPSYLQIVALGIGILNHMKRIRRYGPYPSWRPTSNPSRPSGPKKSRD